MPCHRTGRVLDATTIIAAYIQQARYKHSTSTKHALKEIWTQWHCDISVFPPLFCHSLLLVLLIATRIGDHTQQALLPPPHHGSCLLLFYQETSARSFLRVDEMWCGDGNWAGREAYEENWWFYGRILGLYRNGIHTLSYRRKASIKILIIIKLMVFDELCPIFHFFLLITPCTLSGGR